ncbi:MAG: thiol:disulfide interchange protein DsbA/DsbL [Cellvibrio sp.]
MRIFIALVSMCFSLSVFAAEPAAVMVKFLEGRDYTLLETPVPTLDPKRIEVVEAFSFTCPHCYHFEPALEDWKKKQKPDVALVQTHMQWSESMKSYQRGFYTAVNLKIQDKVQMAVFDRIHKEGKPLSTADDWAEIFAAQGIPKQTTISTFNSFIISDMMTKADARVRAFKISSTPQLVVDGKYVIPTPDGVSEAESHKAMLQIADFLIVKIRAERAAKR